MTYVSLLIYTYGIAQRAFVVMMVVGFSPITTKVVSSNPVLGEVYQIQMRNRSPLWSFLFYFFCGPQGYGFYSIKNFRNCTKKILRRFFANFCHEIGCENDQTYIFRFVRYLSTFFYTNLPINIHFQFIIITNISFVTNPAYFVRHLASPVVLRSRDFSKYNPILTCPKIGGWKMSIIIFKNVQ